MFVKKKLRECLLARMCVYRGSRYCSVCTFPANTNAITGYTVECPWGRNTRHGSGVVQEYCNAGEGEGCNAGEGGRV